VVQVETRTRNVVVQKMLPERDARRARQTRMLRVPLEDDVDELGAK